MKLDPGMHIGMHLVFFGKAGVTKTEKASGVCGSGAPRKSEEMSVGGWTQTAGAPSGVRAGSGME
jgi:hypothetical protein